jgi:hypothetical protein
MKTIPPLLCENFKNGEFFTSKNFHKVLFKKDIFY